MNLLKTTALGLILFLGLATQSNAATGGDIGEEEESSQQLPAVASMRRLNQQQFRNLKEAVSSVHAVSPVDEASNFFHFLRKQEILSSEATEGLDLFTHFHRSFDTEADVKARVFSALKALGITVGDEEGNRVNSQQFKELVAGMASKSSSPLLDQTMSFMRLLKDQSLITEGLAEFFTKALRVEIALDDKGNPDRYTKALGVFDLEVEEPMKSLSAKGFEEIKLAVGTTHSRQLSIPDKTENFLNLLRRKRVIDGPTADIFNKLLLAQRHFARNPEDVLVELGVQKGDSTGVGTLKEGEIQELVHTLDTVPGSLLEKTDLVLNFLAERKAIDPQQLGLWRRLAASQHALSRSMGDSGLRSAFSALGIVIEPAVQRPSSASPKKAAPMTIGQKLGLSTTMRASSQSPLGFSSTSARSSSQSTSRPSSAASPRKAVERKRYVSDELRQEVETAEKDRVARLAEAAAKAQREAEEAERAQRQREQEEREEAERVQADTEIDHGDSSASASSMAEGASSVAGDQNKEKGPTGHPTDTADHDGHSRVSEK